MSEANLEALKAAVMESILQLTDEDNWEEHQAEYYQLLSRLPTNYRKRALLIEALMENDSSVVGEIANSFVACAWDELCEMGDSSEYHDDIECAAYLLELLEERENGLMYLKDYEGMES